MTPVKTFAPAALCLLLCACIINSTPQKKSLSITCDEVVRLAVTVLSQPARYAWFMDGQPLPRADSDSFLFTAGSEDIGVHTIDVRVTTRRGRTNTRWTIKVTPADLGDAQFGITVEPAAHQKYGLAYPLTYRFCLPPDSPEADVYVKHMPSATWHKLASKTEGDLFNGLEAVRISPDMEALVSVGFPPQSDHIYLVFQDRHGNRIPGVRYEGIAPYYDQRRSAITSSQDDWHDDTHGSFVRASHEHRIRGLWFCPGIITALVSAPTWEAIQQELDQDFVEPLAHSRHHYPHSYMDPRGEIGGCRDDIIARLELPPFNTCGPNEYVYAYLEPYSATCDAARAVIGDWAYLADRGSIPDIHSWAPWDDANDTYARTGYSIRMGSDGVEDLDLLNQTFDAVHDAGGIYHLMYHPWAMQEEQWQAYGRAHLDHLAGRNDIWYAGFGHLYLYHVARERGLVHVISAPETD